MSRSSFHWKECREHTERPCRCGLTCCPQVDALPKSDWVERIEWTHAWLIAHLSNGL